MVTEIQNATEYEMPRPTDKPEARGWVDDIPSIVRNAIKAVNHYYDHEGSVSRDPGDPESGPHQHWAVVQLSPSEGEPGPENMYVEVTMEKGFVGVGVWPLGMDSAPDTQQPLFYMAFRPYRWWIRELEEMAKQES